MKTVFLRALEADVDEKPGVIKAAIRDSEAALGTRRFEVEPASFDAVPNTPFAYWVSEHMRRLFAKLSAFEAEDRTAKQGLATGDDFRFARAWWEVPRGGIRPRWFSFAKGGKFAPFYSDIPLVVGYSEADQVGLKAIGRYGRGATHYFQPGLTWPLRGKTFAPRALPRGCIFSVRGYAAFTPPSDIGWTLAVFNSTPFDYIFKMALGRHGFPEFVVGVLQELPWQESPSSATQELLDSLARRAWSLRRALDTRTETSHAFALPALLQRAGTTLADAADAWADHVRSTEDELTAIQAEIDEGCFGLYGIDDADRRAITDGFGAANDGEADEPDDEDEDDDVAADTPALAEELLSWAVGVAFGRFDVRLATGDRRLPDEPEPFDPLPACSPGMLTGDDGLPLAQPPEGYPLAFPDDGVLVDDLGHPRDLVARVRSVYEVVFGDDADRWWQDTAALLDDKKRDLRAWLGRHFFPGHLKRYSKSRRKAPIYWQLATPSRSYSVWLYAHRVTRDTLFTVRNEYVAPKLAHEETQLASLVQEAGADRSAKQRKAIEKQEAFVGELRAMLEELERAAPLFHPDLDDGIVLVKAPLWRLVPQHRSWQKELRKRWEALQEGKYDWAHLAMRLWPERVVPKCAEDRSLAIAHGLEDVFWFEDDDGKWQPREVAPEKVRALVEQRTSPAVKDALQKLLDAPAPKGGRKPRRRRRKT